MTEEQWQDCGDPKPMLAALRGKASARKLRLFACACCRHVIWEWLTDGRSREAVAVAERFADGLAGIEEAEAAMESAADAVRGQTYGSKHYQAAEAALAAVRTDWKPEVLAVQAAFGAYASGERKVVGVERRSRSVRNSQKAARDEIVTAKGKEAALLRDLFGDPFRPQPPLDPAWPRWHDGTVVRLAQAAYEQRSLPNGRLDYSRLAVLADALEEAGCQNDEVLRHLREQEGHWRGCWVLDSLLGKS